MKIEIADEAFSKVIAEDLLWSLEHAEEPRVRKAAKVMAMYYMTYRESVSYFGQEETDNVWKL